MQKLDNGEEAAVKKSTSPGREPWVAMDGADKQVMLVDDGNALIMFTAMYIMLLLRASCRFALENPLKSLAWWHPLLRWIARQSGVIYTHF